MIRIKGIGFVPFKREGKAIKYLLLHHGGQYWNFPKGHPEGLEDELSTALRELEEETGIKQIKIIEGFRDSYHYDFDTEIKDGAKERIYREAIFYLGEVEPQAVVISDEHLDYGWFDYEKARKRLFFQNSRNVLQKAHNFLLKEQGFVL